MIVKDDFIIDGTHGSKLHVIRWKRDDSKNKVIHILHGMAEHCERYDDFARFLVKEGYIVYAHDHRKHGRSLDKGQTIGIIDKNDSFKNIIKDVNKVQEFINKNENKPEIILLGHSMGSLICRRYLQEYGSFASKAIIMGTMAAQPLLLRSGSIIGKIIRLFSSKDNRSTFLNNLVVGGFNAFFEPARTSCDWLSRDNEQVDKYLLDELCGYSYTATFYINLFNEVLISQRKSNILRTPEIPLLLISGNDDPVGLNGVGVKKVHNLYTKLGYEDFLTIKLFDNARHEILNEINKEDVYEYIINWINSL